jgi:hypothetical protein
MRGKAFFFSFALCASLFLTGCWKGVSHEVLATVLSVNGQVTCAPRGGRNPHVLDLGARLAGGASVQVPNGAEVDLALLPGILFRASNNSTVIITELRLIKDGDETGGGMRSRIAGVRLERGSATLSYQQPEQTSGSVAVITDRVLIKASQDSLFCIETDNTHTRVICVRGQVDALDATGKASVIKAGWLQKWDASESIPVRPDSRSQPEIDTALKVEQQLRAFETPNAPAIR